MLHSAHVTSSDEQAYDFDEPLLVLRLGGEIVGANGKPGPPILVHRPGALVLVRAWEANAVPAHDLLREPLCYEERALGDRLIVGTGKAARTFDVPRGKASQVQRAIALARLEARRPELCVEPTEQGPYSGDFGELERAWLQRWLQPTEMVLAWLGVGPSIEIHSPSGVDARVDRFFVLTTERAALVAVGPLGDVESMELPDEPLTVQKERGRDRVSVGRHEWLAALGQADAFRAIAPMLAMSRARRIIEVARAAWARGNDEGRGDALVLIRAAREEGQLGAGPDLLAARPSLEAILEDLPPVDVLDVSPQEQGGGSAELRDHLLTLLVAVRGEGRECLPTLIELAHLRPFDGERLDAVLEHAEDGLKDRARQVAGLLGSEGLVEPPRPPEPAASALAKPPVALDERAVEERLRHPAARSRAVLERLQSFIAEVDVPNHGALRDYCEKLQPGKSAVSDVVADACVTLGAPGVTAYVSRGDKSIGVRAYEGGPNFVLIGGRHLEPDSPHYLTLPELRFAVATEIAHLRFGHARVTSSEVWSGALEKGKATFDMLLSMLPAFKLAKWADRLKTLAEKVPSGVANKVVGQTTRWFGKVPDSRPRDPALDKGTEVLIEAHRMMQLSADRAGLVFSGDLAASVRAMFKLRPVYHAELGVAQRIGLGPALARRTPEGEMLLPDLWVRVGALVGFYLSEDYAELRSPLDGERSSD